MTADLARRAAVPRAELAAIVKGTAPNPDVLHKLGPALNIHVADLFVIAGLPVPPELASAWPTTPWNVGTIIRYAMALSPQRRGRLNDAIRSLPIEPRTEPTADDGFPDEPGALLIRLMRNRNIRPNAWLLAQVGDGPYVSHSTVGMLGRGRVAVTPQYVTAFAHLLGYAPTDMVALTGVGPVYEQANPHPASAELAALAWNARRLTGAQLAHLVHLLEDTRRLRPSTFDGGQDGQRDSTGPG
ncbi:XRE family transcriptional regulator [Catellatospora coxensis]